MPRPRYFDDYYNMSLYRIVYKFTSTQLCDMIIKKPFTSSDSFIKYFKKIWEFVRWAPTQSQHEFINIVRSSCEGKIPDLPKQSDYKIFFKTYIINNKDRLCDDPNVRLMYIFKKLAKHIVRYGFHDDYYKHPLKEFYNLKTLNYNKKYMDYNHQLYYMDNVSRLRVMFTNMPTEIIINYYPNVNKIDIFNCNNIDILSFDKLKNLQQIVYYDVEVINKYESVNDLFNECKKKMPNVEFKEQTDIFVNRILNDYV